MIKNSTVLVFILLGFFVKSQNINPTSDKLYLEEEVTEIRINIKEEDNLMLHLEENRYLNIYVEAEVTFTNSELDQVTIDGAGLRLRGNTARNHDKRSYKIDFKEFGGEKFESYKKINLKPNVNDPAHIRELISMHVFRLINVPAPRVAPAILYINEEYKGVYLNIEQIDDEFIDKRYGSEEGFLYKCSQGTTLAYKEEVYDEDKITSKMNEVSDDRDELSNFIDILNNTSDAIFKEEIEKIFNVNSFIRQMAVEAIIGHWDGYSWFNNNYYLFFNPSNMKFEFIVYDTDNTFGIDWANIDWAVRDLNHFYSDKSPLASRILNVEVYRNSYYRYLNILFDTYFTEDYLFPKFDYYKELLGTHVQKDTYFDNSFNFSYQNFLKAFEYEAKRPATYGLKDYVSTRRLTGIPSIPEDINQAPTLNDETFTLAENSLSGYLVGTLTASDLYGETLSYAFNIISGNTSNAFSLDSEKGDLKVSNRIALDYEITPRFVLQIEASDGFLSDTAVIIVNLIDLEEEVLSILDAKEMIYPNPSGSVINIKMGAYKEATIFNLSGKKIIKSTENRIDISRLSEGTYIIKLQNMSGKHYSIRLIKK